MNIAFSEYAKECRVGDHIVFRKNGRIWRVTIKIKTDTYIKGPYTDDNGVKFNEGMFILDGVIEVLEGSTPTEFQETVAKFVEASRL